MLSVKSDDKMLTLSRLILTYQILESLTSRLVYVSIMHNIVSMFIN